MKEDLTVEIKSWYNGYIQALQDYGTWKDGQQVIGALETPIFKIIKVKREAERKELAQLEK